jgi:hypothetical protein
LQYGLINLGQLDKIFDWLETAWFCWDLPKRISKTKNLDLQKNIGRGELRSPLNVI